MYKYRTFVPENFSFESVVYSFIVYGTEYVTFMYMTILSRVGEPMVNRGGANNFIQGGQL